MLQPRLLMSHWIGTPALAMQVQLGAELLNRCMGHVKLLVKHALCSPASAGWNMTSFDKGPGSGAFPSPTQARMGGLERTQPVVPAPTHRGPATPSVMASQSQPSLPTTLESQATAGPRGGQSGRPAERGHGGCCPPAAAQQPAGPCFCRSLQVSPVGFADPYRQPRKAKHAPMYRF